MLNVCTLGHGMMGTWHSQALQGVPVAHRRRATRGPGYGTAFGRRGCEADPDLAIDEDSVIVLKNAGPQGAPGMPEWGQP